MKMKTESEDICNELKNICDVLRATPSTMGVDDELFSQITKRLADVEARLYKIESLLTKTTVAGNVKPSDIGKEIARKYWQNQN